MTGATQGPPKKRALRYIVWACLGLAGVLGAATIFLFSANHSYLEGRIESLVSAALGRDLSIDGELSIEIDDSIEVSVNQIALAATEWSSRENLLEIDSLDIGLDLGSILGGPLHISHIEIRGIRLYAEINDQGENNWTFDLATSAVSEDAEPLQELPVRIEKMQIENSQFELRRPQSDVFQVSVERLKKEVASDNRVFVELAGEINQTGLGVQLTVNDVNNLSTLRDIQLEIDGSIGEVKFGGNLGLENALEPTRPSLDFHLSGPNVEYLTDVLELPRLTTGALALDIVVQPADARMAAMVNGTFGEFDINIEGFFDNLQDIQDAELLAAGEGPNAAVIAGIAGITGFPAEPFDVSADLKLSGTEFQVRKIRARVGETRLSAVANLKKFPTLDGATASLQLEVPEMSRFDALTGMRGRLTGPLTLVADVSAAESSGANLRATVDALSGRLALDGLLTADLLDSDFDLELNFKDSAMLMRALNVEVHQSRPLSIVAGVLRRKDSTSIERGVAKLGADELRFSAMVDDQLMAGDNVLEVEFTSASLQSFLLSIGVAEADEIPGGALTLESHIATSEGAVDINSLTATLAGNTFSATGDLERFGRDTKAQLNIDVAGASLSSLLPGDVATAQLDKPYRATAKLDLNSGQLALSEIDAELDQSTLNGSIEMSVEPIGQSLRVDLNTRSPNVLAFLPPNEDLVLLKNVPLAAAVRATRKSDGWTAEAVNIDFDNATVSIKGDVGEWPDLTGTSLQFEASTPDVSRIGNLAGVSLPADSASANFHANSIDNGVAVKNFMVSLGANEIEGDLKYINSDVPSLDLTIRADHLDVSPFLSKEGEAPSEGTVGNTPPPTRLIPETPIPYRDLARLDSKIDLRIAALETGMQHFSNVVFLSNVADGELLVEDVSLQATGGGNLQGTMGIRPLGDQAEFWIRLLGENIEVGLPAETEEDRTELPRYDLSLALISTGNTIRDVASSANGYLKLSSGAGRVRVDMMRAFSQDFMAELLNTVNPFVESDPYTDLNCTVVLATVENGNVHGDPALVVQSDKLKIVARSSVDFSTEVVDADITTVAQKGLGVSLGDLVNPFVKIGGTLSEPELQLDKQAAILEGGAAVATGGISILAKSLKSRFLDEKDLCAAALVDAEERFAELEQKYGGEPEQ